jgi:nitrate reductase gamma subunit
LTTFVVGHFWRYRYDQFGWTTRSSQMYESRLLALASPLFHFGILGVLAGHVIGLLVPAPMTAALGITEVQYHVVAATAGAIAGAAALTGLALLIARRRIDRTVFHVTTRMDRVMYAALAAVVILGMFNTVGINILGPGHDYRADVSIWIRSILLLQPEPELMTGAPLTFQLHALLAFGLLGLWPFTRLVHVFSVPLGYIARPYVVYRTRGTRGGVRTARRGWEPPGE